MINASSARTGDLNMLSIAKIQTFSIYPNVKTKLFMIYCDFSVLFLLST